MLLAALKPIIQATHTKKVRIQNYENQSLKFKNKIIISEYLIISDDLTQINLGVPNASAYCCIRVLFLRLRFR